jgi:hypothetical protein
MTLAITPIMLAQKQTTRIFRLSDMDVSRKRSFRPSLLVFGYESRRNDTKRRSNYLSQTATAIIPSIAIVAERSASTPLLIRGYAKPSKIGSVLDACFSTRSERDFHVLALSALILRGPPRLFNLVYALIVRTSDGQNKQRSFVFPWHNMRRQANVVGDRRWRVEESSSHVAKMPHNCWSGRAAIWLDGIEIYRRGFTLVDFGLVHRFYIEDVEYSLHVISHTLAYFSYELWDGEFEIKPIE